MIENELFILLGTNLGDRIGNLEKARIEIDFRIGKVTNSSKIYETAAWGIEDQPSFLNQILVLNSGFSAEKILTLILNIEEEMGRKRVKKWAERLIDIDIIYWGNEVVNQKNLKIPHPYLHERRFTLMPLVEVAADFIHPIFKKSNSQLLKECTDRGEVVLIEN